MSDDAREETQLLAERVRSALTAGDLAALEPLLADDVRFGTCVGSAQVVEWMQGARADGLQASVSEVTALPDRIVLALEVRPRAAGDAEAEERWVYQVLFVRDGESIELGNAADRDEALAAAPSGPPPAPSGPPTRFDRMAAILPVRDLAAAVEHYRRLGFAVRTYDGGGYGYAERGGADFHFSEWSDLDPRQTTSAVYLYVDDADALYAEWRASGATGQFVEPVDTEYGLREGAHIDRDGNLLRFGSPLRGR